MNPESSSRKAVIYYAQVMRMVDGIGKWYYVASSPFYLDQLQAEKTARQTMERAGGEIKDYRTVSRAVTLDQNNCIID